MSKVVLGRGIEALIPTESKPSHEEGKYRLVPPDLIGPNPLQPRHDFDQDSLQQLADSLKRNGMIQPLVVKQSDSGFTIIAGERRLRAARIAGLKEVPVVLMDEVDEPRMLELALVENLQREDLNPLEAAEAYHTLIERCGLTQNELAVRVGKSRTAVANILRLRGLPEAIKLMIREGKLSEGHARAILAAGSEEQMLALAQRALRDALSVRDVEREAGRGKRKSRAILRKDPILSDTETFLKQLLGTSVTIHPGRKKGRIEIEYYGDQDLDRLLELFRRIGS
ncbi:MAG: ParB/RepB/Spo0J family partition protein [Candidatus Zixiibacteriota bacterium]|nr:MAG: ParB/RepB/Spo0J family partition protein [candidate division Zixibacteria bacterium]